MQNPTCIPSDTPTVQPTGSPTLVPNHAPTTANKSKRNDIFSRAMELSPYFQIIIGACTILVAFFIVLLSYKACTVRCTRCKSHSNTHDDDDDSSVQVQKRDHNVARVVLQAKNCDNKSNSGSFESALASVATANEMVMDDVVEQVGTTSSTQCKERDNDDNDDNDDQMIANMLQLGDSDEFDKVRNSMLGSFESNHD